MSIEYGESVGYLLTLMRNQSEARANLAAYLPWSYAREEPNEEYELRAA